MSSELSRPESAPSSSLVAAILAVSLFGFFCAHIGLFVVGAAPQVSELSGLANNEDRSLSQLIMTGWSALVGSDVQLRRLLPALASACAFWLLVKTVNARTHESVSAGAVAVGLIIFPTAVFAFVTDAAAAFALLLSLAAVAAVSWKPAQQWQSGLLLGSCIGLLPFIDAAGAALGAGLVVFAIFEHRTALFWGALSLAVFVIIGGASQFLAFASHPGAVTPGAPDALRSYAMLWIAILVSILVLFASPTLRRVIGPTAARSAAVALAAFAVALLWLVLAFVTVGQDLTRSLASLLGLALIATAPFALWIRLVMPRIRSVWIWILLPVLMYCCFWVVLSAVDLSSYPYSEL